VGRRMSTATLKMVRKNEVRSVGEALIWDRLLNLQREGGIHQSRPAIYGDHLAGDPIGLCQTPLLVVAFFVCPRGSNRPVDRAGGKERTRSRS
jgi:hypothetical protein